MKTFYAKLPLYVTQSTQINVNGFYLGATLVSLVSEPEEYEHRLENGVHTWVPKKVAVPPRDERSPDR